MGIYRIGVFMLILLYQPVFAQGLNDIISEGDKRLVDNQSSQVLIDGVSNETQDLAAQYQEKTKIVDGLKVYNALLGRQLQNQEYEANTLRKSITDAAVIERQILPMLSRMVDSIDTYISLDMPFLQEERRARVATLRRILVNPGVTNAEKARRVFEAFQIENDFGNTIESYKGKLNLAEKTYDVDFLRVGRIAFMYRAVGQELYGHWDAHVNEWVPLTSSQFIRNIDKGIKIARQEIAPELITIPAKLYGGEN